MIFEGCERSQSEETRTECSGQHRDEEGASRPRDGEHGVEQGREAQARAIQGVPDLRRVRLLSSILTFQYCPIHFFII